MAAGSISVEKFNVDVASVLEISAANKDTWFCEILKHDPETKFLVKKTLRSTALHHRLQDEPEDETIDEHGDGELDDAVLTTCTGEEAEVPKVVCSWEYHIVYSPSYGVPVLYFNANYLDGRLLTLEEVWQSVPRYYQQRLQHERWSFITQQEHPLLQRPFFQLHPCHTATLMDQVLGQDIHSSNYLLTWLSSVGPVVHLDIPLTYFQTTSTPSRTLTA